MVREGALKMRSNLYKVPGVVHGENGDLVRKDLKVRIVKSDWTVTLSILDDEKLIAHIQLSPIVKSLIKEALR